jgi:hypothetical protein
MERTTTLVVKITWNTDEVPRPGRWDWANLIDVERGHVEILADSDDRPECRAIIETGEV